MGLDFNQNKLFGKGDEDAMQLSKRTIVKSVLFVIAFWAISSGSGNRRQFRPLR